MSLLETLRRPGKHRRLTPAEVKAVLKANAALTAENDRLLCSAGRTAIAMEALEEQVVQFGEIARQQAARAARAFAEQQRLRQAVINARPRFIAAVPALVPPYAAMALPYPVPVQPRDTSGETTCELPILDLPELDDEPIRVGWEALTAAAADCNA